MVILSTRLRYWRFIVLHSRLRMLFFWIKVCIVVILSKMVGTLLQDSIQTILRGRVIHTIGQIVRLKLLKREHRTLLALIRGRNHRGRIRRCWGQIQMKVPAFWSGVSGFLWPWTCWRLLSFHLRSALCFALPLSRALPILASIQRVPCMRDTPPLTIAGNVIRSWCFCDELALINKSLCGLSNVQDHLTRICNCYRRASLFLKRHWFAGESVRVAVIALCHSAGYPPPPPGFITVGRNRGIGHLTCKHRELY